MFLVTQSFRGNTIDFLLLCFIPGRSLRIFDVYWKKNRRHYVRTSFYDSLDQCPETVLYSPVTDSFTVNEVPVLGVLCSENLSSLFFHIFSPSLYLYYL